MGLVIFLNNGSNDSSNSWFEVKSISFISTQVVCQVKMLWVQSFLFFTGSTRKKLVPMLFTEEVVVGISLLVKYRNVAKISEDNNYIFASGSTGQPLRGWDTLQGLTKELDLEKPKLITPTRTRKAVSTMMQLLNLSDGELTWITNHMGHTKDVQRNWYRKEDSTIELTKVARALIQVDIGTRDDLQNKRIDDLTLGIAYRSYVKQGSRVFDFFLKNGLKEFLFFWYEVMGE